MVARNEDELRAAASDLGGIALPGDIADPESIAAAVEAFRGQAGGIDLLVANAGVMHYAPFAEMPLEHSDQMVDVNVSGTIYTVKAALDGMLDAGRGHIVVVSSGAGLRAFPWGAVYGATKAANRAFAEALRHELSGTGVSVTTIFPGEVATDLHSHQRDRLPDWRSNDEEMDPADLAAAILAAVDDDRRNVYAPSAVRLLGLNGVAPKLTDRLLAAVRGGAAAPRRD